MHAVAGVLKLYLRQLADPLLPASLYDQLMTIGKLDDKEKAKEQLVSLASKLPTRNKVES